jgi:nitroreductase
MNTQKRANPDHELQELLIERWSPYGFSDRSVSDADLRSIFEAARWAASSYNEQPWRYIVATKADQASFNMLLSCLVDTNQSWAVAAPVLTIGCASLKFSHNGHPNLVALHDLGAASANLTFEATARGLSVHQMAGILPDRAREIYRIPEGFEALTALAIGYAADPNNLPDNLKGRDLKPRTRKPLSEFVFGGEWGTSSSLARS